ncbi:MAG: GH1 family beta-glucosidase [Luteolibacter sp.]
MKLKPAGDSLRFPKKFTWGVATAAAQIEGAAFEDGKGWSVWDTFARVPGNVANGDTLDVACDHYHRYENDLALMAELGVKNYRFSIAWPRIYPVGRGKINPKGVDFYNRLIDAMLAKNITPWATMFHWDLPQTLEDEGGWRVRGVVEAFGTYADTIVKAYGDRVKRWITLNEIDCFTGFAYGGNGDKAPGTNEGAKIVNQTYHHALLAHGEGVRSVREHGGRGAVVGLSDNTVVGVPFTELPDDIAAAKTYFINKHLRTLDPIYQGYYSDSYLKSAGRNAPKVEAGDFDIICQQTDFLGQNIYTGYFVRAGKNGKPEELPWPSNYPAADAAWIRHLPQSLYWSMRMAHEIYGVKALYITENGAGYHDTDPVKGEVNDLHRCHLIRHNLIELHRALTEGVPVKGCFLWSFMDNFEWADGYRTRFGLVHTDYKTQKRTPKFSARWYSQVMRENRIL